MEHGSRLVVKGFESLGVANRAWIAAAGVELEPDADCTEQPVDETCLDDLGSCRVMMVVIEHHFHINVNLASRSTFLHYIGAYLDLSHALAYNIDFTNVDDRNDPSTSLNYNALELQATVAGSDYTIAAIIAFE